MTKYTQEELNELELKAAKYDRYVKNRNRLLTGTAIFAAGFITCATIDNIVNPKDKYADIRSNGNKGVVVLDPITGEPLGGSKTKVAEKLGVSIPKLDQMVDQGHYVYDYPGD